MLSAQGCASPRDIAPTTRRRGYRAFRGGFRGHFRELFLRSDRPIASGDSPCRRAASSVGEDNDRSVIDQRAKINAQRFQEGRVRMRHKVNVDYPHRKGSTATRRGDRWFSSGLGFIPRHGPYVFRYDEVTQISPRCVPSHLAR